MGKNQSNSENMKKTNWGAVMEDIITEVEKWRNEIS